MDIGTLAMLALLLVIALFIHSELNRNGGNN